MDDEALDPEYAHNGQDLVISTEPIIVTTYSSHAKNALRAAEEAATTAPGGVMTCEHLLLSLCGDPECAASQVLERCGFPADRVIATIAFLEGPRTSSEPAAPVILSPRVERVLTNAGVEAGHRKAEQIDTLHLLIGLVRERKGIAAMALETPGVGHELVGAAISNAMRNGMTDPS